MLTPPHDFSGYPALPIYTIAINLQEENDQPIGYWLNLMTNSICIKGTPLPNTIENPLILCPDNTWGIDKPTGKTIDKYAPQKRDRGWSSPPPPPRLLSSSPVLERIPWEIESSVLWLEHSKEPDLSEHLTNRTQSKIEKERINVKQDYFRPWFTAVGYPLPRFWFSEVERQQAMSSCTPEASPKQQRERIEKQHQQHAAEYAAQQRQSNTPMKEVIGYIETNYGFDGQELHDLIWPEHTTRNATQKRKELHKHREKK